MRSIEHDRQWQEWIKTRPGKVQETALKYPPGTRFKIHDKILHVIAYGEDGSISVTETDPFDNYAKAVAERQPVCKCCLPEIDSMRLPDP